MNVICIEENAFYELVETVIKRSEEKKVQDNVWISGEEVMKLLYIESKSTLQKLRDTGEIRYSQYCKKLSFTRRPRL